jgi:outer membrane protein assembly factor BamB
LLGGVGAAIVAGAGIDPMLRTPAAAQTPQPEAEDAELPTIPPEVEQFAADWPLPQGSYDAHRAAASSSISAATVDRLEVAWRFPLSATGGYGAVTANPIVLGDTVYLQDMESNVFALDRATGDVRWRRDYTLWTAGGNGVVVGYGLVFGVIGIGAEAFALRADTGDEVWRTKLSANLSEFLFVHPIVHDGLVYVSTSPGAYVGGSRGILFALDARSGEVRWQWDTTTDNLWGAARLNAGGGVWYPPSVDEAGNIYFGIGNPAPWPEEDPAATTRPGPNLYSSSMVSLDPSAGSLRWHLQASPHDQFDHDFQNTPILAEATIDGRPRRLAIGSGKTGTVIAADADTGEELWRAEVGDHTAYGDGAPAPPASATPIVIAPGFFGGVLTPMAFDGATVFAPVINLPLVYTDTTHSFDLADATGEMVALNVADGRMRWRTTVDTFFCGGATVANDLVFGAGLDGVARAFETERGREVWTHQAGAGVNASPAIAGDMLFVAAGAPFTGGDGDAPEPQAELIAFRLVGSGAGTPAPAGTGVPAASPVS